MEMVAFRSSINRVADENVDSTLLMVLLALTSKKLDPMLMPDVVLNLLSKICTLLMVELESSCSLGMTVKRCFPPFS